MTSRTQKTRPFSFALLTCCVAMASGCGSTVGETGENAKNFGVAVGSSAKEAGLKVGDAFNKTFRSKKGKDEASAEVKKAEPTHETTKKQ